MSLEDLSRDCGVKLGSDRSFGLVIAAALTLVALAPLLRGENLRLWALAPALILLALALGIPESLRPLNLLWFKLGQMLHKITNPVIMGVLFFGVMLPVAVIFRLRGNDPLNRAFDKEARSYWLMRSAAQSDAIDMRRQF